MAHARRSYNLVGEKDMLEPWLLSVRGRVPLEDTVRGKRTPPRLSSGHGPGACPREGGQELG